MVEKMTKQEMDELIQKAKAFLKTDEAKKQFSEALGKVEKVCHEMAEKSIITRETLDTRMTI